MWAVVKQHQNQSQEFWILGQELQLADVEEVPEFIFLLCILVKFDDL